MQFMSSFLKLFLPAKATLHSNKISFHAQLIEFFMMQYSLDGYTYIIPDYLAYVNTDINNLRKNRCVLPAAKNYVYYTTVTY